MTVCSVHDDFVCIALHGNPLIRRVWPLEHSNGERAARLGERLSALDSSKWFMKDGLPAPCERSLLLRRIADLEHRLYEKDLRQDAAGILLPLVTCLSTLLHHGSSPPR